jgi:hypothetical protein
VYRVLPYQLWIGHAGDGRDFRALFDSGIRAVVQLAFEEPPLNAPREFMLFRFPLMDGEGNDVETLGLATSCVASLIEREIATLVCCSAGMSRSPCLVAAALCLRENTPFDETLVRVAGMGPADISPGLCDEIRRWLASPRPAGR